MSLQTNGAVIILFLFKSYSCVGAGVDDDEDYVATDAVIERKKDRIDVKHFDKTALESSKTHM